MGRMQFNAAVQGHTVVMDGPERVGGDDHGPIPRPLVLTALTGCTGMDVVALLRRWGKTVDSFCLKAGGEESAGHPIEYIAVHLVYDFRGQEDYRDAALDAVTRS